MKGKGDKVSKIDLGALERDLLDHDFNEVEDGGVDEMLMLMTPASFMSHAEKPPASLSPEESMSLIEAHQKRDAPSCSANLVEGGGLMNQ